MNKISLISVITLGLLTACSKQQNYSVEPLAVETEIVSAGQEAGIRNYVGTVEEEESVSVSFLGTGTLKRITVSEGQAVHQGQLLAEIDDTQARNLLETARASYTQAEDAIARYKQLYDKGSLPEAKWIEAQSKLDQAKSSLQMAEKNLADCRLTAPMNGIVGKKMMTAGMTVLPSEPVLSIYKINNVKVKVSVPECEIADITAKTSSKITVPAIRQTVDGGEIEKGIVADALTHTYDVRIQVNNKDQKLLPGMACEVKLDVEDTNADNESSQKVITVPVRCVQQSADGNCFVWVVSAEQTACRQIVSLGQTIGNRIEVKSGLKGGEKVIIRGYQKVSENSAVRVNG